MEQIIQRTDANLAKITTVIDAGVGQTSATSSVVHGGRNSQTQQTVIPTTHEQTRPAFQVRSIKLDFPGFDGSNVVG